MKNLAQSGVREAGAWLYHRPAEVMPKLVLHWLGFSGLEMPRYWRRLWKKAAKPATRTLRLARKTPN